MIRQCLDCFASMTISDDAMQGEVVECPDCGQNFEIDVSRNLKRAETISEDWGE